MTVFQYDAEILTRYPTVVGGVILARCMTNGPAPEELQAAFLDEQQATLQHVGDTPLSQITSLAAWRAVFRSFGVRIMHRNIRIRRQERYRILKFRQRRVGRYRRHKFRRHHNDQLRVRPICRFRLEELAQNRNITDEWDLLKRFCFTIVEQSAKDECLTVS